jgi:WYL domain
MPMDDVEKQSVPEVPRRWGQERRFAFIDFRLLWDGRINRSDLTTHFGISVPQASMDLASYQELAPQNLIYDKQQKAYIIGASFRPITEPISSYSFLNSVRQVEAGMLSKEDTFLGWYPPNGLVRLPSRRIEAHILRRSLAAIRGNLKIWIRYQSMHHPEPELRAISPHAIVFDGVRWHLRGFCYKHQDFRDFVLSRIAEVSGEIEPGMDSSADECWHSRATVIVGPAAHLSKNQQNAIALDYGMHDGQIKIETREALLLYLLQQLPLYSPLGRAKYNQIVLRNREELQPVLDRLGIDVD